MVEHWSPKPGVASSSLAAPAIMTKRLLFCVLGLLMISFGGLLIAESVISNNVKTVPEWVPLGFCKTMDHEPPVITLNGDQEIAIKKNYTYEEAGATVVDDCDEVELTQTGEVDTSKVGTYKIT